MSFVLFLPVVTLGKISVLAVEFCEKPKIADFISTILSNEDVISLEFIRKSLFMVVKNGFFVSKLRIRRRDRGNVPTI